MEEKLKQGYYRVRTSWEDDDSQVGQYKLLKSAITKCHATPGTYVFADDGAVVYPSGNETPVGNENTAPAEDGLPILFGKTTVALNVRKEATQNSEVVTVLKKGTLVEILEDCGEWYRIFNGYVSKPFLNTAKTICTVQSSDTLQSITKGDPARLKAIFELNNLTAIRPGMTLLIP